MILYDKMIIIGGTGRNIGKTRLAEMAVKKLSSQTDVIAVKISNVNPGNKDLHGSHELVVADDFLIYEENNRKENKDSMRFLKAGAKRSFFIITDDEHLPMAFGQLLKRIKPGAVMVCESNSLRQWVKPGLLLMVVDKKQSGKEGIARLLDVADDIVPVLDQTAFEEVIEKIKIIGGKVVL